MAASERQQRVALSRITELASAEIGAALRLADPGDSAAIAEIIVEVVPTIADRYGLSAGTLAAQWYESMRAEAEVAGAFNATPASLPDAGRYEALAAWAADKNDVETLVSGGVQRIIANAHRGTVMQASFADPRADGWARFSSGTDTCAFCYMLITRGAVFERDTARFATHDHCSCGAGPVFKGKAGARKVSEYRKSARRREDKDGNAIGSTEADQERAKQWIEDNL